MLEYKRVLLYIPLLSGFYTFIIVYSLLLEFGIIILISVVTGLISYIWILISLSGDRPILMDYRDLFINIFTFYFITFYIIFITIAFSGLPFNAVTVVFSTSPILIWTLIWIDFYFQRVRARI